MKVAARFWARIKNGLKHVVYCWNRFVLRRTIKSPPTFIVGCGHSGTSILLSILDAHPNIFAIPYESNAAASDSIEKFQASLTLFDKLAIVSGKRRWVEKTPRHILCIGKILEWEPKAKVILMLRDGRDVAYSIQKRTGSLEEGIRRWCDDNFAARQYWESPNVYVLKYEDLINDFEASLKGVLFFLGEEYDSKLQYYFKRKKKWYSTELSKPTTPYGQNHEQYRNWQINQPLFDGRGAYREMSHEEQSLVEKTAGSLLYEFGYTR